MEKQIQNAIAQIIRYDLQHPQRQKALNRLLIIIQQLPPQKVSEIARELKVNHQTLYSHWKQKCLPLLREIGKNYCKGELPFVTTSH